MQPTTMSASPDFISDVTVGSGDVADEHDYNFVQQIAQEINQLRLPPLEQTPVMELDENEESTQRDREGEGNGKEEIMIDKNHHHTSMEVQQTTSFNVT